MVRPDRSGEADRDKQDEDPAEYQRRPVATQAAARQAPGSEPGDMLPLGGLFEGPGALERKVAGHG